MVVPRYGTNGCRIEFTRPEPKALRQSLRDLCIVAATSALSFAFVTTNASAFDLTDLPSTKPVKQPPKNDPSKCDVSVAMTTAWIENNPLTDALNKAYQAIADDFPNLTDDKFGHAKSKNISSTRTAAGKMLNRHRGELWAMSQRIAGNLVAACDKCQSLNTWGKLKYIADVGNVDKFGAEEIKNLTRFQLDSPKVIKEIDDYLELRNLRKSADPYPTNADSIARTNLNYACIAEFKKKNGEFTKIDTGQCNKPFLQGLINGQKTKIGKELDDALANRTSAQRTADVTMSTLTSIECRPATNYGYMSFAKTP